MIVLWMNLALAARIAAPVCIDDAPAVPEQLAMPLYLVPLDYEKKGLVGPAGKWVDERGTKYSYRQVESVWLTHPESAALLTDSTAQHVAAAACAYNQNRILEVAYAQRQGTLRARAERLRASFPAAPPPEVFARLDEVYTALGWSVPEDDATLITEAKAVEEALAEHKRVDTLVDFLAAASEAEAATSIADLLNTRHGH